MKTGAARKRRYRYVFDMDAKDRIIEEQQALIKEQQILIEELRREIEERQNSLNAPSPILEEDEFDIPLWGK